MTGKQLTMKHLRMLAVAFCLVFVGGGMLAACSEQGPAEKAGEKIDDAADDAGDAIDDAVDEANDAIDDATN